MLSVVSGGWPCGGLLVTYGLAWHWNVWHRFCFLSITLSNHNHDSCHVPHTQQDFVQHQVNTCYDFGSVNYWPSLVLNAFLGNQTLHHLFPTLDPVYFPIVEEELKAMGYEYERHSFCRTFFDHVRFISSSDETHNT